MKKQLINLIKTKPVEVAHLLGFKDMTSLHNNWLIEMIFTHDDKTLLAHRGSYKTTCLSIAIAFIMILFPFNKIIFLRKTDDDVIEVIKQVSNILKSELFKYMVDVLYGVELMLETDTSFKLNTNLNTTTQGAVQLLGIGTSGSLTGKHADLVITDDIVNLKDRISRAERERIKTIYMELQNVKNRGGRILNTGTPWHKEDAISGMPNVTIYDCYHTDLISKEELQVIRSKMTPSLFSANYELKHIADEDALFTNPKFFSDKTLLYDCICHIDASYGGADGTAFTLIRKRNDKYYVLGLRRDKHIDDCLDEFYLTQAKYRGGTIHVEKNADKGYLVKEMRNDGVLVQSYNENMNKFIKISTYLRKNWENIYFYEDTDPNYLNEILDYTENAQHDDAPDSLASIIRQMEKGQWMC